MNKKQNTSKPDASSDLFDGQRGVHMKFWPQTIEKMETLKRILHTQNKTTAVRAAIDIALYVTQAINDGDEVIIRTRRGKESTIIISGL